MGAALTSVAVSGVGDAADAGTTITVTIEPGDTLSAIAARYDTTVAALVSLNDIANPNFIVAGAHLLVPTSAPASAPASAAPSPGAAGAPVAPVTTVVVRPGDTLTSIAARYQTTVAALVAANHITNPNLVFAGAHLVLPAPPVPSGWEPGGPLPAALVDNPARVALRPDFLAAANASGEPASLLEALCWWESGWQVSALSPTGAEGICQLEPSTVDFAQTSLLHDAALNPMVAADNISMAAAYLANLTARVGGNSATALAAYYQGLTSLQQSGMKPSTKTYVTGILNYAALFASAG